MTDPVGLEARVGEQAMETDREAVPGDGVEDHGEDDVEEGDGVTPQQRDRHAERDARSDHEQRGDGSPDDESPATWGFLFDGSRGGRGGQDVDHRHPGFA